MGEGGRRGEGGTESEMAKPQVNSEKKETPEQRRVVLKIKKKRIERRQITSSGKATLTETMPQNTVDEVEDAVHQETNLNM